jgi:MarR family transcriptional regulator, transcriptional regulator for hemolysin
MTQIATRNASTREGKSPTVVKKPKSKRTPEEINWDTRLGFLMHDVSRLRRTVFDEFMKPLGVTRSQWWVLAYLSRHDGMIQSDLADMLELGKAALGGLVDRLESSDFIQRRADATDRRVKRIYLTDKGVQIIKEMRNSNHDMSERILNGLNEAERQNLFELLALVKKNLVTIKEERGIE